MIKLVLAQITVKLGDLKGNLEKITKVWDSYENQAELIVFPELSLIGYPPEDLVENQGFLDACDQALTQLIKESKSRKTAIVLTHPIRERKKIYNTLHLIESGKIIAKIHKSHLPNYGIFDEKRNFKPGRNNDVVSWQGKKIGFLICEDAWGLRIPEKLTEQGAEILISLNASPYDLEKPAIRHKLANHIATKNKVPFVYVNLFTAQDGIVFDGGSFIMDKNGEYVIEPVHWKETLITSYLSSVIYAEKFTTSAHIYNALIVGLRSYIEDNGFKKALVGISGGIDSAFVATLAADAIGPQNVELVKLPSKYSSDHSDKDANVLALALGIKPIKIPIQASVDGLLDELKPYFITKEADITEENLQSRVRGVMLMALSNKNGAILLTTGNKSEYACGYATIYGDMCGGFAPIKDIYKTQLYELCRYRNSTIPSLSHFEQLDIIPENSILKPPSAELAPNQLDTDKLPEYSTLDKILYELIERNQSISNIIAMGYDSKLVQKIYNLFKTSEYKRRQSAIGTKISTRDLGKERRYPITNFYKGFYE
jgi:NAD+ synthetase